MKKGWQTKKLGEICTVDWGNTDLTKSAYVEGGKFLAVSAAGCDGRIGHKEHEKYTPVLSAIGAQCGRMFLPEEDFTAIKNTITLTPRDGICTGRFLYQLLTHVELPKRGAAQPFISKGDIQSFQVPVPPLAEQQRIVGLLDEAFEGLATAKANAEKNLQNARALFESHLQSVFTQSGPGWVEKTLGDVFTTATGTTPPKNNADFYGDFMPLVKPPELCDEAFDSAPDGLSEAGAAVARTLPAKSILVSCIGNLGKIGLNTVPVAFNQQINAILPDESQAIPEFMFFQSLSPAFKSQLESLASGTTVPIVNKSKFNSVSVLLPSLPIQKSVVAQLSDLREETQRLARIYEQKLAALEALKKSLLHQAFTGEL